MHALPLSNETPQKQRWHDRLHLRWLFPSIVFILGALPLLVLAFDNDHHMAEVFHPMAYWWAAVVHILLLLIPIVTAFLPREDKLLSERNIAMGAWFAALLLALVGNVMGGIAHSSGRTISQVLDNAPTQASALRMSVGAAGGLLIVVLEFALGRLAESNLSRLFFGHSPAHAEQADVDEDDGQDMDDEEPPVHVARPSTSGPRTHRLSRPARTALADNGAADNGQLWTTGQAADRGRTRADGRTAPPKGADKRTADGGQRGRTPGAGQRTTDKGPVIRAYGQVVSDKGAATAPADSGQMDTETLVRPSTDTIVAPVRPSADTVIPVPEGLTGDHMVAVEAYAVAGNVRDAAALLQQRGVSMGKSKVNSLVQEAKAKNPDWVEAMLSK